MKLIRLGLALALLAAVGCTASPIRLDKLFYRHISQGEPPVPFGSPLPGQAAAAKRCDVRVAWLARPLNDPVLNQVIWRVADEQAVPDDLRRRLAANGVRIGLISTALPGEVSEILLAPPPHQVEPIVVNLPSGESQELRASAAAKSLNLLINTDGHVRGHDYTDAHGILRLTATHNPSGGVALRLVPELHHGPVLHRYTADATSNPFAVQQFLIKDGQQEDAIRELAATVVLQQDQVVVMGCDPDRPRSLGHFLLTEEEVNSDRVIQKVILIWAAQGHLSPIMPGTAVTPSAANPVTAAQPAEGRTSSNRTR
jgi:hypothetical protein